MTGCRSCTSLTFVVISFILSYFTLFRLVLFNIVQLYSRVVAVVFISVVVVLVVVAEVKQLVSDWGLTCGNRLIVIINSKFRAKRRSPSSFTSSML